MKLQQANLSVESTEEEKGVESFDLASEGCEPKGCEPNDSKQGEWFGLIQCRKRAGSREKEPARFLRRREEEARRWFPVSRGIGERRRRLGAAQESLKRERESGARVSAQRGVERVVLQCSEEWDPEEGAR